MDRATEKITYSLAYSKLNLYLCITPLSSVDSNNGLLNHKPQFESGRGDK